VSDADNLSVDDLGPVDCVLFSFPGNKFKGEIVPALQELVAAGTVHIIDLAFVLKDEEGNVTAVELSDLDPEDAQPFDDLEGEVGGLLNDEDFEIAADALEPNSSALFIVWENVWAAKLASAIRGAGGEVVMHERIPRDVVAGAVAAGADAG
jgi:uncharacterized membrane protein